MTVQSAMLLVRCDVRWEAHVAPSSIKYGFLLVMLWIVISQLRSFILHSFIVWLIIITLKESKRAVRSEHQAASVDEIRE